jgi:hemerythrin-like metal-binding protein
VQHLAEADDVSLPSALEALSRHTRQHFAAEEAWMDATDFPARQCHSDEHAAVFASIEGVGRRLAAGETEPVRRLATALAEWFPGHADYLDAPLAHWLCKRRFGGKPVVFQRRLISTPAP